MLNVATCQLPTSVDTVSNHRYIEGLMAEAKARGAHVAHFPEAALSGYAGADFSSHKDFDWHALAARTREVMRRACELELWVVLGSAHPLTGGTKPHNSLYIIDSQGQLVDRYDKRFCAGDAAGTTGDLAHYSPGDHPSIFEIAGVRCGALICHDYRYPELYREYKRLGVALVFHSYHAAHVPPERLAAMQAAVGPENGPFNWGATYPGITMPASMVAAAASNHVWISCPNSSARESLWPSFFVRADGVITGQVALGSTGLIVSTVDVGAALYDSTIAWRDRALYGVFHSGNLVDDERSRLRTEL